MRPGSSLLLTGGTGTFGRAFVQALLRDSDYDRICIFSRGEHAQAAMRAELRDDGRLRWFIGDVRDADRLRRAMEGCDTVVHAAALKRVEVGEYNPHELVKTNVLGTQNVVDAAFDVGAERVVVLSSDKACEPLNAYGASKLMAEKLALGANNMRPAGGPMFAVTRYGNVAGSQGSVIAAWRGPGPYWIGDPDSTRFWMFARQAVELVSWTIRYMRGGELVVPELPAYRLGDLAEAMLTDVDKPNALFRTARAVGDKLHESMISAEEARSFQRQDGSNYFLRRPGATADDGDGAQAMTSDRARRLSVDELRELLLSV